MYQFNLSVLLLVTLLFDAAAAAQASDTEISNAIRSEIEETGAPSIQVAIAYRGSIVYEDAFGYADVENQVLASSETRYRTASISKWFTATAALQLAEQGLLDLDEPIQSYCPSFPEKRWPITARQLLTHTSGVRHYADYESALADAQSPEEYAEIDSRRMRNQLSMFTRYTDIESTLESFKDDPLVFEPGTNWLYSSFGYRLLACVIEGASERSYRAVVYDQILEPLHMTSTTPDDAWEITPHRAAGYRLDRGEPLRRADMRDVSENLPAGGHLATAGDLVRFAQAFDAGMLVTTQSITMMTDGLTNHAADTENFASWRHAIPSREKYAYGLMSFPNEDALWIGHTGRQAGASSILVLVPERDLSIAILTNVKGWGGFLSLSREILSIIEHDLDNLQSNLASPE